jgi:chain length determinant protein EpsF
MSFSDFLRILRARWMMASCIVAALTIAALVSSLVWTKKYTASALLMIDLKVDPVAGTSVTGVMPSAAFIATQVDIIESQHVAKQVIKKLDLLDDPAYRSKWQAAQGGNGDFESWLSDFILESIKVEPARESNTIEIRYTHPDAKMSALMANTFAKSYINSSVQFKTDPARQYSEFFEERANLARQKLEKAQTRLAEAQKAKGILVTDERLDAEMIKLNDLSQQLTGLRGVLADSGSRSAQANKAGDIAPEALASVILTSLRSDSARMQAKLEELLESLGEQHPSVLALRANIATTQEKIRQETTRVGRSIGASDKINQSRLAAVQLAYNEQRDRLLKLKEDRNELLVIEREVAASQRLFDAIQSRQSQMNLEGSNQQNNVVVLNTAAVPVTPASPRVFINTLIGFVLGSVLSAFVIIMVEMKDRTVRGTRDIVNLLNTPVLGYMSAQQQRKRWWQRSDDAVLYPMNRPALAGPAQNSTTMQGRLD